MISWLSSQLFLILNKNIKHCSNVSLNAMNILLARNLFKKWCTVLNSFFSQKTFCCLRVWKVRFDFFKKPLMIIISQIFERRMSLSDHHMNTHFILSAKYILAIKFHLESLETELCRRKRRIFWALYYDFLLGEILSISTCRHSDIWPSYNYHITRHWCPDIHLVLNSF